MDPVHFYDPKLFLPPERQSQEQREAQRKRWKLALAEDGKISGIYNQTVCFEKVDSISGIVLRTWGDAALQLPAPATRTQANRPFSCGGAAIITGGTGRIWSLIFSKDVSL